VIQVMKGIGLFLGQVKKEIGLLLGFNLVVLLLTGQSLMGLAVSGLSILIFILGLSFHRMERFLPVTFGLMIVGLIGYISSFFYESLPFV
jgi:hypothetical protein